VPHLPFRRWNSIALAAWATFVVRGPALLLLSAILVAPLGLRIPRIRLCIHHFVKHGALLS
jgi:hypothetical protein